MVRHTHHLRDARKRLGADARRAGEAAGKRTQGKRDPAVHQASFVQTLQGGRVHVEFHAQTTVFDLRILERLGQVVDGSTRHAIV